MPELKFRPPSYRIHKASGLAVVTVNGHDHYLGEHGSSAGRLKYNQPVAQWAAMSAESMTDACQRLSPRHGL